MKENFWKIHWKVGSLLRVVTLLLNNGLKEKVLINIELEFIFRETYLAFKDRT